MNNPKEKMPRRDFLKVAGIVAGSALLDACALGISKLSPTEAIARPTLAPTKVATADTAARLSEPQPIPRDQMDTIVAKMNTDLKGGYILSPNPDGTYAIKGPDGTAVKNIILNRDGNVYLTRADGTVEALPPGTVKMPRPDTIYASFDQLDVKTGNISEIPIKDTYWLKDPEKSPKGRSLADYDRWVRNQLENTGILDKDFATVVNLKWEIATNISTPTDIYKDGKVVSYTIQALYPAGTNPRVAPDINSLPLKSTIPILPYYSFVSIEGLPDGVSVMPVIKAEITASGGKKYDLFPGLVDSAEINIAPIDENGSINFNSLQRVASTGDADVPYVKYITIGAILNRNSMVDGLSGKSTLPLLIEGADPVADAARLQILQNAIKGEPVDDSINYFWPLTSWVARK